VTRDEAEDYIYESYLAAQPYLRYSDPDSLKRHPELTRDILRSLAHAPAIVVTGSKGKGSVARMVAALLGRSHAVGLMTSPHILKFNERFSVDGKDISDDELVSCLEAVKPAFDAVQQGLAPGRFISPIGIETAIALTWFERMGTDIDVLECGKGARYDDVPNVPHRFAAINTIFAEHTRELGPTVGAIAHDKSYVITPGMEGVFVAPQQDTAMEEIQERAESEEVPLFCYGRDFEASQVRWGRDGITFDLRIGARRIEDVRLSLLGEFQARNAALAVALAVAASETHLADEEIRDALASVRMPGRLELLQEDPPVLLDACINRASCSQVLDALSHLGIAGGVTTIIGIPDDKDFLGVADAMKEVSGTIMLTASSNPHYVFTEKAHDVLAEQGMASLFVPTCTDALRQAREIGRPTCILGTTSLISDIERLVRGSVES